MECTNSTRSGRGAFKDSIMIYFLTNLLENASSFHFLCSSRYVASVDDCEPRSRRPGICKRFV